MGHGVTPDVESSITELAHLASDEITWAPQKAEGDVKSGSEIHLAQNRRSYGQVGFAPVVERDDDSAGSFLVEYVRDRESLYSAAVQPIHLLTKVRFANHVTRVALLTLTQRT